MCAGGSPSPPPPPPAPAAAPAAPDTPKKEQDKNIRGRGRRASLLGDASGATSDTNNQAKSLLGQ
jgi:hypothetical protein